MNENKSTHNPAQRPAAIIKSPFRLALSMFLALGALLVAALPSPGQTTNVDVNPGYPWYGYQNYYDTNGTYLGGAGVPNTADLRAHWLPNAAAATRLLLQPNTNTYKLDGTNNLPDGTPNRLWEQDFYVDVGTNYGGLTEVFSGTVETNGLPAEFTVYAFVKEFGPGYCCQQIVSTQLVSGASWTLSRTIAVGDIAQFGFYTYGPNAAPGSANAQTAVSIYVTNSVGKPPVTVKVDPAQNWLGFLNYLTTSDAYLGGFVMAPTNLPAGFFPSQTNAQRVILGINSSTYDATATNMFDNNTINSFDDPDGTPNKHLELDFYVDVGGLYSGTGLTFSGTVESNSLPAGWVAYCVIKEFAASGGYVGATPVPLPGSGPFSVSRPIAAGDNSQYGFYIYGPNAAPGSPATTKTVSILVAAPLSPVTVTATRAGSTVHLTFPTQTGASYTVLYKNHLTDASWTVLPGTPVAGTGSTVTVNDTVGGVGSTRFYRVSAASN